MYDSSAGVASCHESGARCALRGKNGKAESYGSHGNVAIKMLFQSNSSSYSRFIRKVNKPFDINNSISRLIPTNILSEWRCRINVYENLKQSLKRFEERWLGVLVALFSKERNA